MQINRWRNLMESGVALIRQGQPQKALPLLQKAVRQAPRDRDVRYWLANACRMTGKARPAELLFRELLAENPADFDASFALAFLLRDTGTPGDAAAVLLQASGQGAVTLNQLLQIAGFLRDSNQFAAAIEVCEKALKMNPRQPDLLFKLARLYQATGAFDPALDMLRKVLDLKPSTGPAWTLLAQQKRFADPDDADFGLIRQASGQSHGQEADMCIAFAFGKALDDLQHWREAWAQYQKGNRTMSRITPWDAAAWEKFVEQSLTRQPRGVTDAPDSGRRAVFIVGMPRSGTTLLEQMLDRHPDITGRGELNFLAHFADQRGSSAPLGQTQRREMSEVFWTQLRLDGPEEGSFVDKNPLNFRYLDLLFEILPTARVLHLTRDGRASGLSTYFQLFQHADTAFSYGTDSLISFYLGYRRLMAHWENVFPERILQVDYKRLVNSPEAELEAVLSFIGREWDDAVTQPGEANGIVRSASVWQARQAIHTQSVERWRHYHEFAPEFFDRLAAIDSEYGQSGN